MQEIDRAQVMKELQAEGWKQSVLLICPECGDRLFVKLDEVSGVKVLGGRPWKFWSCTCPTCGFTHDMPH
jgi:predicted RNA-binding Zn-ribbon protein involved in translation (DUF1610 family)